MFQRRIGGLIAMGALLVAACGPGASSAPSTGTATGAPATEGTPTAEATAGPTVIDSIGQGEGELNLIVWPGYAESGANVPEYDWVHPFEAKTSCKVQTIKDVRLEVAQTAVQNVRLAVGQLTEEIAVVSEASTIESATTSVGQVITERTVQEIPLNGRHFVDLGLLIRTMKVVILPART